MINYKSSTKLIKVCISLHSEGLTQDKLRHIRGISRSESITARLIVLKGFTVRRKCNYWYNKKKYNVAVKINTNYLLNEREVRTGKLLHALFCTDRAA